MDPIKLGCGDTNDSTQLLASEDEEKLNDEKQVDVLNADEETEQKPEEEMNLKDRIAHCRNIIDSLKFELHEEKAKLEQETRNQYTLSNVSHHCDESSTSEERLGDFHYNMNMYSTCVDSKLNCDEKIMEYEKQLEKYQNTLTMAQIEKKNAIRKQMLAKAFSLKLMEVENQCNIELLRVKQSLQCLEPLQMIASKWKNDTDDSCSYDLDKFELMPRYPEINSHLEAGVDDLLNENAADNVANDELPTCDKNY